MKARERIEAENRRRRAMTIMRGPVVNGIETVTMPQRLLRDVLDLAFEEIDQRTVDGKVAAEVLYAINEQLTDMFWQRPNTIEVRALEGPCEYYGCSEPGDDCLGCGWEATWHRAAPDAVADPEEPEEPVLPTRTLIDESGGPPPVNPSGTFDPTKVSCWHGQTPPCMDCRERRWGACASCGHVGILLETGLCESADLCNGRLAQRVNGTHNTKDNDGSHDDLPF